MKEIAKRTALVAALMLAIAVAGVRISATPGPQVKSGVDRLYVIDCGDGIGPDESLWTPRANVGKPVGFPTTAISLTIAKGGSCGTQALMMPWRSCLITSWCYTNGGRALARSGVNQSRSRVSSKNYTSSLRISS